MRAVAPLNPFRRVFRKNTPAHRFALWMSRLLSPFATTRPLWLFSGYTRFCRDFVKYRQLEKSVPVSCLDLYPQLYDRVGYTPIDYNYFYQDTWLAGKLFFAHPHLHVDVGSSALLVGIMAQFTSVVAMDIRPLAASLARLQSCAGSVTALPFRNASVSSVSSLCVLEHIGLGRYGDPLDAQGTDRAAAELCRVLAPGGDLYVSVPIEPCDRVYFNAHRAFSVSSFVAKFPGLALFDASYAHSSGLSAEPRHEGRMMFGLFHLRKTPT
jgi:hypothetical protein